VTGSTELPWGDGEDDHQLAPGRMKALKILDILYPEFDWKRLGGLHGVGSSRVDAFWRAVNRTEHVDVSVGWKMTALDDGPMLPDIVALEAASESDKAIVSLARQILADYNKGLAEPLLDRFSGSGDDVVWGGSQKR